MGYELWVMSFETYKKKKLTGQASFFYMMCMTTPLTCSMSYEMVMMMHKIYHNFSYLLLQSYI